jgi:preprotein translocase subunit SecA
MIAAMREGCITDLVRQYVPAESMEEQWNCRAWKAPASEWQIELAAGPGREEVQRHHRRRHPGRCRRRPTKCSSQGGWWAANFTQFQRAVLLQSFDTNWRDHLAALDYLRQGIHLRGYAQKQPKQEYKREASSCSAS